jgi:hypothetical protein
MLYKLDGNAIGSGGVCNNEYEPQHDTWLAIREVGSDGFTSSVPSTGSSTATTSTAP